MVLIISKTSCPCSTYFGRHIYQPCIRKGAFIYRD